MAVTTQQIAEAAGVSRGTVDRALNNRGRINPEVAEKIKQIAKDMGYQTNKAGRALAMSRHSMKIGVIIQSAETPFMKEVMKGIRDAKDEVERMGGEVELRQITGNHAKNALALMEEFREASFNAIALVPTQDEELKRMIDQYHEVYQIPVVTLNSDLSGTKRTCFVGQNTIAAGKAAAGLMAEIVPGAGSIAVISGNQANPALSNRVKGFGREFIKLRPDLTLLPVCYTNEDRQVSEQVMTDLLNMHPDLRGVYMASPGEDGVCDALEQCGVSQAVKMIAHDYVGGNKENLKKGTINFLLGQNAYVQGYEPVMILFRILFEHIYPEWEHQYTNIEIQSKYNT